MRRRRVVVVFLVALLGYLGVFAQLVRLQWVEHDMWVRQSHRSLASVRSLPFERGWILDRQGEPLAMSVEVDDLIFEHRGWRRGTVTGQVWGVCQALGAPWRTPAEMDTALGDDLPALGGLTVGHVAALEPRDRRIDLGFYLERLFGKSVWAALLDGLGQEPRPDRLRLDELPGYADGLVRAQRQAAEEADAWSRLTRMLGPALEAGRAENSGRILASLQKVLQLPEDGSTGQVIERDGYRRLSELQSELEREAATLVRELHYDAATLVSLREGQLSGLALRTQTRRSHPLSVADVEPLLVGTVGEPGPEDMALASQHRQRLAWLASLDDLSAEELDESERLRVMVREIDYQYGEEKGRLGVEAALEAALRGKRGWEATWLDADGQERRELEPPRRGLNVTLTLDIDLQRACQDVLDVVWRKAPDVPGAGPGVPDRWAGAIVLLDPQTGDVLAAATSPRPTRSELTNEYGRISADSNMLLSHRAVFAGRSGNLPPPGSTFKPVSALAGLAAGVLNAGTRFHCDGKVNVGDRSMGCLGVHGDIDLHGALAASCNVFFYRVGEALGVERLTQMLFSFGFGSATPLLYKNPRLVGAGLQPRWGISEASPRLGPGPYNRSDAMRLAIGQAPLDDVTPLQVASMMATLGTGVLRPPRLIRSVDGWPLEDEAPQSLNVSPGQLALVRAALASVVDDTARGTARQLALTFPKLASQVAGKTGTAEVGPGGKDQSWFAGYLPRNEPRLAFAILVEDCGLHGSEAAVPLLLDLITKPAMDRFLDLEVLFDVAQGEGTR